MIFIYIIRHLLLFFLIFFFSDTSQSGPVLISHPFLLQVVPHVVPLVQSLKSDGLPNSRALLLQFTELIHCMMYQYSGFPDMYDSILEAIKVSWGIYIYKRH